MENEKQASTAKEAVSDVTVENSNTVILKPESWKLLIVDDEDDIHKLTRLALDDFTFEGRGVTFISAKSEEEAKKEICKNSDIALILLDVVMETDDAGLKLVRYIRDELKNNSVQIVLRTGQPGRTPQKEAVTKYDINGYTSKVDLTAEKMFTIVAASFRAYWLSYSLHQLNARLTKELEERKRAEEAIRQLTQFQETVIDNANIWLNAVDENGCMVIWNMAAEKISGYSRKEVMGRKNVARLLYPDKSYRKEIINRIAESAKQNNSFDEIETTICRKDGQERMMLWDRQDLQDNHGHPIGSIFLGRDVTEHRLLESQLRQAQKMEAVGRMAGGLAHDFNNLLTVIKGYCDIILARLTPEYELYDKIRQINKAAERAESLTRQLLSFSRHQVMKLVTINLNSLILDIKKMLTRLISADIELATGLDDSIYNIRADYGHIEQIIMNLVVNARDAMPKGGTLTIETQNIILDKRLLAKGSRLEAEDYVMLSISDTGSGMDEETKERIFEPFFTTKEEGKGTGLGLSTVYGIVGQSNGHILVESELGEGTVFKIYFPSISKETDSENINKKVPEQFIGTETILIVEDQPDVLKFTCEALQMYGYKVLEASNAGGALLICEECQEHIHLIITDVIMPKMNGLQLVRRLSKTLPDLKVLFMSGYAYNIVEEQGDLQPGQNFLQKPFTAMDLLQMVRKVIDHN